MAQKRYKLALCFTLLAALPTRTFPAEPAAVVPPDHAEKMTKGIEIFKGGVRGILTESCLKCHGGEKTKGDFDLTTRELLLKGGADGVSVVPGKSSESRFFKLLAHTEEPYMPKKLDKLPAAALAQIAAWIDSGAPYDKPLIDGKITKGHPVVTAEDRKFWSFMPLRTESPLKTTVTDAAAHEQWAKTPIDNFVLSALQAKKLTPNPVADKRSLIRRAYFDLTGLPPKPEEIDSFVNDAAPDAYAKLIDRLLDSPHYGERWGRHWLDIARFAESHGYEQDYDRPAAYHYRDFVIQALNQDMPYDRFVRLQIAGDELEPDNRMALMATGFLAAGTHATQITASQVEKERYDELDDMASTVGTSLLGMTVGCARCHDHKFDPIPQKDYYRMISTFTTTVRSEIDLDFNPEKSQKDKAEFEQQHVPLAVALERYEKESLPKNLEAWLKTNPEPPQAKWLVLEMSKLASAGGATFARQEDGSYLAGGTNAKFDTYTFTMTTTIKEITAVKLEALADKSMVKGGPGRAGNGNFALTDFRVSAAPVDTKLGAAIEAKLVNPKATFEQSGLPIAAAIDNDKKSAWAIDPEFGKNHAASFEFEKPLGFEGGTVLTFTLKFENNDGHNIGRPRLSLTTAAKPVGLDGAAGDQKIVVEIGAILRTAPEARTAEQKTKLMAWYRPNDAEWNKLNQAVQEHLKNAPKPQLTKVMVATEGLPAIRFHTQGADFFDKTFFLKRGDLNQKDGEATSGFLQVLTSAPEQEKHWQTAPPKGWRTSYRRRAMADWITDKDLGAGRLLARVIVNRLWQHHFGRGIVATPNDFGVQGERPTHPELLDWLASELIQNGWKLKPLHKAMMTSATYMQSTQYDAARAAIDPENTWMWRRSRRRLEAEVIRDSMLAVSGTLDEKMFGPGSLDEAQHRRSIYFTTKRSKLIPMMSLFDAPDSLQSLGLRSSTTVAPQAMALMNNTHIRECAKALAARISTNNPGPDTEVAQGYLLALGRIPEKSEIDDMAAFLLQQGESYKVAGKGNGPQLALTDFCQALMSLNEFVYEP